MSKVTLKVEIEEKDYKALIGEEVFNIWRGNEILSTVFNAIKTAKRIEECEDAVSRTAVLDVLLNGNNSFRRAEDIINELPFVLPKREKGEWCEQNDDYFDWYECSECGYGSEGEMQYSSEHDVRTKYCPNCGAEMKTESEEKE